jgi:putative heme transporter
VSAARPGIDGGAALGSTGLDQAAWFALRSTVVLVGAWALLGAFDALRVVLIPSAVAVIAAASLHPVAARLTPTIGRTAGALVAVGGALAGMALLVAVATWMVVDSIRGDLVPAVEQVWASAERWLEEGPLQIDRSQVDGALASAGDALARGGALGGSLISAGHVVVGLLLALVLTVFAVRDLDVGIDAVVRHRPDRERLRAALDAALGRLRRYLFAVVALGTVEGVAIGGTVALVSSPGLGVGVGALTFVAAFFPIVGATVAGAVAVLAVLAVEGLGAAIITLVVAVGVQQFDNELLAPLLYGRAMSMHPALVLVALTAGGALAGLGGAALAVPVTSAVLSARAAWREGTAPRDPPGATADG